MSPTNPFPLPGAAPVGHLKLSPINYLSRPKWSVMQIIVVPIALIIHDMIKELQPLKFLDMINELYAPVPSQNFVAVLLLY